MTDETPQAPASDAQLPMSAAPFAGWVWDGTQWWWTTPDGQRIAAPPQPPQQPVRPASTGLSSGRIIGAVIALVCAAGAGLISLSWLTGYAELEAQGNQFAGLLALLGMGGLAVAAGFGITGIVLLTRRR